MTKVNAISGNSTPLSTDTTSHIHIILDETGSMNSAKASTISSFNEFIGSQKSGEGECVVSLTTFSNTYGIDPVRTVYANTALAEVKTLTDEDYTPRGITNLYDAIGDTIHSIEKTNVQTPLVVIITDGDDNSSKKFGAVDISTLISAKTELGWTFVYLGANQDAWSVGQSLGLSKGQTMTYSTDNMGSMMSTLSSATTTYRSMRSAGVTSSVSNFFDGEEK